MAIMEEKIAGLASIFFYLSFYCLKRSFSQFQTTRYPDTECEEQEDDGQVKRFSVGRQNAFSCGLNSMKMFPPAKISFSFIRV